MSLPQPDVGPPRHKSSPSSHSDKKVTSGLGLEVVEYLPRMRKPWIQSPAMSKIMHGSTCT